MHEDWRGRRIMVRMWVLFLLSALLIFPTISNSQTADESDYIVFSAIAKDGVPAQVFMLDIAREELTILSFETTDAVYPQWLPAEVSPFSQ
jgi:hypothetical protein